MSAAQHCPVAASLGRHLAAAGHDESLRLAIESETDLMLTGAEQLAAVGRALLDDVMFQQDEALLHELSLMLGTIVRAAYDRQPIGRLDVLFPHVAAWALAHVDQRVDCIVKKAA